MKRFLLSIATLLVALLPIKAQLSEYDINAPFGWATCSSMTSGDDYELTGGGDGSTITLVSAGTKDMRSDIINAINKYDVIVFDGSKGDFIVSSTMSLKEISDKTIVGINNARICTQFYVTEEITAALDKVGVRDMSSSGGGGKLSNGTSVAEEREYYTRQTLIDLLNDEDENYRRAGLFSLSGCENIIFRNLSLVGPGPIDVGGDDLVSIINSTTHIWIDHCNFTDGIDGNLDITIKSDFVTISWSTFAYTDRAYDHMNSNLIGSNDTASSQGENNLNVTWANNIWGNGCKQRMPMARFGTIHLINNYYNCPDNTAGINARKNSEFLIENNYFAKGVKKIFSEAESKAYNFSGNIFTESFSASNKGSVSVPYQYTPYAALDVPSTLTDANTGAGATLDNPLVIAENNTNTSSSDTSLASLTVNGDKATPIASDLYFYHLPASATQIAITATAKSSTAQVSNMLIPNIKELPADATFAVTAEDGTIAYYTLELSQSSKQYPDGKVWNFTTWSDNACRTLAYRSDVWSDMGDGRYENTFSNATELAFVETESITFSNDVRINPSTSGAGYIQGALSMNIPVIEGQTLTFHYSHTSNTKGSRDLLVNGTVIGSTSSIEAQTATYTVPGNTSVITVKGSGGLRYYKIEMSEATGTPDTPTPDDPTPDNPSISTQSWVFDDWADEGAIPSTFNATFTHAGLTVIYGTKAKFGSSSKSFDDGRGYSNYYDTGGGGSTESQALSFEAQANDELTIYSNAGERSREVVIYNGSDELLRQSDDIIKYTLPANGTYYIYSGNSAIRFYALHIGRTSHVMQAVDSKRHIVYAHNAITTDSDLCIEVYNIQGVCVAQGYRSVDVAHLQQGIYIARCGSETLRFVRGR